VVLFQVLLSLSNNGFYTVVSSVYNVGPDETVITVVEPVPVPGPGGRIIVPQGRVLIQNATAGLITSASIVESFAFTWGTTVQFNIVSVNQATDTITVSGDAMSALIQVPDVPNDRLLVKGTFGIDDEYEHISSVYNIGPNTTDIVVIPSIPIQPDPDDQGVVELTADITSWFQYLIKDASVGSNTLTIWGNASVDVQVGTEFRVMAAGLNNGLYRVLSRIVDTSTGPTLTIVTVDPALPYMSVVIDGGGGFIESARDYGIRMHFSDALAATVLEDATAVVLTTGGSIVGAWDFPYWDIGSFDESLGTLINLYSNTF